MKRPRLTVVVAVYNMVREAPRTLQTLTAAYQNVPRDCFELIVVDNGSSEPLGAERVQEIDPGFHYRWFEPGHRSPAAAINAAVRDSQGEAVAVLIDGARMLSPGFFHYALLALRAYRRPLISTLGCHLGHQPQQKSVQQGYDAAAEDQLLASVPWQRNGYSLFRIACLAGSSKYGILAPLAESNALVMRRQMFDELGGLEEGFTSPGGGLVNLDFYQRAQALPGVQLVTLLGEASFHQVHGGASTGATQRWQAMTAEYAELRGRPFDPYPSPWLRPDFWGQIRPVFRPWLRRALSERRPLEQQKGSKLYGTHPRQDLDAPAQQRVLAVLGMHRSGTSLLTGTLQEAGLVLGDVVTAAPFNQKGNRESLPIRTLHDDLLAAAGGSWSTPPDRVSWRPVHQVLRDQLIARFADEPIWGFKDPRTLLCLEGWLDGLPDLELVAMVRHPLEVAASLLLRDGLPVDQGLRLWQHYNQRLLHWTERRPVHLLTFDADPQRLRSQLARLLTQLHLPRSLGADELTFFDPELRHQQADATQWPSPACERTAMGLYDQLSRLSIQA